MTDASQSRRKAAAKASDWRETFLAELADTSNVSASARKAGVSTSHAYRTRRSDKDFAARWQVALCEGYDNLEMELLYRMRTGELRPAKDAKRGVRHYDNPVALRILAAHRDSAARQHAMRANVSAEEVRASLEKKVDALRRQAAAVRKASGE